MVVVASMITSRPVPEAEIDHYCGPPDLRCLVRRLSP